MRQHRPTTGAPTVILNEGISSVIILGLILLLLGFALGIGILWTVGVILIIIGAVFWVLGSMDRAVAGRRHYW
jgi:membrane-bound ClpP family serine protease